MTPLKAIRSKCLDCSCGSFRNVELCPVTGCALYPFRFGKNPNINHTMTPARQAVLEKAILAKKKSTQTNIKTQNPNQ